MKIMGCVSSRPELEENSRVFRVINVDTSGHHLRRGRLEITDTQLIFHQKGGGVVIRWPLSCLRRYGFDSEIFSFECGRRCATGSGIYGFKCRRAEALFTLLQESINNPPPQVYTEPTPLIPPYVPNGVLPTSLNVDESGYLEPRTQIELMHPGTHPIWNPETHAHFLPSSSVRRNFNNNNGTISPGAYVSIHESPSQANNDWPSSLPRCCSLGACSQTSASSPAAAAATHHYVNNEVIEQEVFINQYVNQSVIVAAEQLARSSSPTKSHSAENTYVNSAVATLSPGHLERCSACSKCNPADMNTNYAKMDDLIKQEQSNKLHHFYVNVKPESTHSGPSVSGRTSPTELTRKNTAASLVSPSSAKDFTPLHCPFSVYSPTTDVSKEYVNYAELDLDATESGQTVSASASNPNSLHSLTSSPAKSPEGYAQIDFDKTVALSNSSNPCPSFNDDSMRKTRHNAVIPYVNASM